MVLSQWLLTISNSLIKTKIEPYEKDTKKIIGVIDKYHKKYVKEHNYTFLEKTVEEAIKECDQIMRSPYSN